MHNAIARTVLAAWVLIAGACGEKPRELALPKLPDGPIELRVAHVVNPRFPKLGADELQWLLAETARASREHFGVHLTFTPIVEVPIDLLFRELPDDKRKWASETIYDFKSGKGDRERLARVFGEYLRNSKRPMEPYVEYLKPHVAGELAATPEAVGRAMADLQLARIDRWKQVTALDGRSIIDAAPYNEFAMWLALGHGNVPYELIITNQPLVSVEYGYAAPHAAIRGGYSNGVTTYSRSSRFGTFAMWSTFALTSDDPWVVGLRENETYTRAEAARLAGVGAAHEVGHHLFHFLDAFSEAGCLMRPVPTFAYRAWAQSLDPRKCPIGSSAATTPGAYKFIY